jgi:hypothetical protein
MGFQTGSQIDPRLGKLDYSGYAKAGEIQANALANLGAQVGAGIEKYAKKKEDKKNDQVSLEFIKKMGVFPDYSDEEIMAGIKSFGGGTELVQAMTSINDSAVKNDYYAAKAEEARRPGGRAVKPTSTKDIDSAQGFLDENDLVAKDGRLFKRDKGFLGFGGSLNEVQNPEAYLGVQGVRQLLDMSQTGYGTVNAAPQEGFSIVESGAQNAPDGIEEALESVAPKDPTKSNRSAIRANSKPYEPMRYDAPERLIPGGRRGQR